MALVCGLYAVPLAVTTSICPAPGGVESTLSDWIWVAFAELPPAAAGCHFAADAL